MKAPHPYTALAIVALLCGCSARGGGDSPSATASATSNLAAPVISVAAIADYLPAKPNEWACDEPGYVEKVRTWDAQNSVGDNAFVEDMRVKHCTPLSLSGGAAPEPIYVDFIEDVSWAFSPDSGQTWLHGTDRVARIRIPLPADEPVVKLGDAYLYAYADARDLIPMSNATESPPLSTQSNQTSDNNVGG